jgi:hypothetical protein
MALACSLERECYCGSIVKLRCITMSSRLLICFADILALSSCSSPDKALPVVLRDGEDLENRHSKGSWLPHNS